MFGNVSETDRSDHINSLASYVALFFPVHSSLFTRRYLLRDWFRCHVTVDLDICSADFLWLHWELKTLSAVPQRRNHLQPVLRLL